MQYYVLYHDFNAKHIEKFDIFKHGGFNNSIEEMLKPKYLEDKNRDDLIKGLDAELRYYFWAKCEYEIYCCGLFDWKADKGKEYYPDFCYYFDNENGDKLKKIDIYYQVCDNIELIADGLIREWESLSD